MSPTERSLDVYMQRLDVMCSVVDTILQPGGRATKGDLRNLKEAAQKVIREYQHSLKDKNVQSTG